MRKLKEAKSKEVVALGYDENEVEVLVIKEGKGFKDEWLLDSSSSYHVCGRRELFSSFDKCKGKMMHLG